MKRTQMISLLSSHPSYKNSNLGVYLTQSTLENPSYSLRYCSHSVPCIFIIVICQCLPMEIINRLADSLQIFFQHIHKLTHVLWQFHLAITYLICNETVKWFPCCVLHQILVHKWTINLVVTSIQHFTDSQLHLSRKICYKKR